MLPAITWTTGVYLVLLMPSLPPVAATSGLILLAQPLLFLPRWRWLALLLAGIAWGVWRGSATEQALLESHFDLATVELSGRVVDLPESDPDRARFRFAVDRLEQSGGVPVQEPAPRIVQLSWYGAAEPRAGEYFRFQVRLRRPRGLANFGLFNYGAWLLSEGIGATGYVVGAGVRVPERDSAISLSAWRASVGDWLVATRGVEQGGLLAALAVGDRRALEPTQWDQFTRAGLVHLLAISGLHIGIAAACGIALGRLAARSGVLIGRRWDAVRWGCVGGVLLACGYSAAAGFTLPTQRALVMVCVFLAGQWWRWRIPVGLLLALAMAACAAIDPMAVLTRSLWFSFGAVAVLVTFFAGRSARTSRVGGLLAAQWALLLGYSAIIAVLTGLVAPLNSLANLIAIPVTSFVTVPCLLAGLVIHPLLPDFASVLLDISAWGIDLVGSVARIASLAQPLRWQIAAPPVATVAAGVVGGFILLLPRCTPFRSLGWCLLVPLLIPIAPQLPYARVTVVDVGQGSAALIETASQVTVVDTGAHFSERFDSGADLLLPLLVQSGWRRIDRLIVSHADADHAGGAAALLDAMPIGRIDVGMPLTGLDAEQYPCIAGDAWRADGIFFKYLYPEAEDHARSLSDNDRSCVLRIEIENMSILFPGDITGLAERRMIQRGQLQPADVVVVPHHGSRTSSSPAFVARLAPRFAVVSSGYRNPFGHPHPLVAERWEHAGSQLVNTADDGSWRITWQQEGGPPVIETARGLHRFWWQL